jgi:EmrB/QacA subfamily drug resistance transporter
MMIDGYNREMSSDETMNSIPSLTKRQRWFLTVGLLLGIFLAALEATVVSTAMPTVVASLGGLDQYSWVFSAYLLTSTASVPLWGRLSDLYGRRRLYLAAIALFLAGSMLAGVSQSMFQLVLWRALQGLGAGGLIPLALTIIGEIYTLAERTRMQAVFSSVWGVSSIAGPLVGGFITDSISWRWVFYLNLPIGLIAAFIIHRALPEHASGRTVTVDWQGGILLFLSTTVLLVALSEMSLVWATIATISIARFVFVERTAADPILPLALFRNRTVTVATAFGFLAGMALFGTIAFIPLLIQLTTGGSATSAGQILTPLYLTWVLASIVAARLLLRIGTRASAVTGAAHSLADRSRCGDVAQHVLPDDRRRSRRGDHGIDRGRRSRRIAAAHTRLSRSDRPRRFESSAASWADRVAPACVRDRRRRRWPRPRHLVLGPAFCRQHQADQWRRDIRRGDDPGARR